MLTIPLINWAEFSDIVSGLQLPEDWRSFAAAASGRTSLM